MKSTKIKHSIATVAIGYSMLLILRMAIPPKLDMSSVEQVV